MIDSITPQPMRPTTGHWGPFHYRAQGGRTYLITYYKDPQVIVMPARRARHLQRTHPDLPTTETTVAPGLVRREFSRYTESVYRSEGHHLADPDHPMELVFVHHHGHTGTPEETIAIVPLTWFARVHDTTVTHILDIAETTDPTVSIHRTTTHDEFNRKQSNRRTRRATA